jgi:DNA-binding XRE family transcriptional regulator
MNIKNYCHSQVSKAVREGRLVPNYLCSECGQPGGSTRKTKLIAHHDEYSIEKALDVRWMHYSCHVKGHWHTFKIVIKEPPSLYIRKSIYPDGSLIRSRRLQNGLTQSELAKLTGISRTSISYAENGVRMLIENYQKISKALGVATP